MIKSGISWLPCPKLLAITFWGIFVMSYLLRKAGVKGIPFSLILLCPRSRHTSLALLACSVLPCSAGGGRCCFTWLLSQYKESTRSRSLLLKVLFFYYYNITYQITFFVVREVCFSTWSRLIFQPPWKILWLNQKRINSVLNIYLHKFIWSDDFTWSITDPFWYMCLNLPIKITCWSFCRRKRYPVIIFSRNTLYSGRVESVSSLTWCLFFRPRIQASSCGISQLERTL